MRGRSVRVEIVSGAPTRLAIIDYASARTPSQCEWRNSLRHEFTWRASHDADIAISEEVPR